MVSPELALIDPELSRRARAVVDVAAAAAARPTRPAPMLVVLDAWPTGRSPARRWADCGRQQVEAASRRWAAVDRRRRAVGAVAVVVAVGAVLGIERIAGTEPSVQRDPIPTSGGLSAPDVEAQPVQARSAKEQPAPAQPAPIQAPGARRLAWAPVGGAVGYEVELFLGEERILSRRTSSPVLEVPSQWSSGGRQYTLGPAEYRWYVWPITDAGRAPAAVVQATLVVAR